MLRLVRKLRLQQAADSKNFWVFTITEFILVILGILIALQIENWNQNRQVRKLESVLLNELLLNLNTDYEDIRFNINALNIVLNSSEIVLSQLEEKSPYNDSLEYHFGELTKATIFNKNLSAFESIKSIGLDIIKNNTLRQQISYLYSVKYDIIERIERLHHQVIIERLYPICGEHFRTIEIPVGSAGLAIPIDYLDLYDNDVFKEAVKQSMVYLILQIQEYQLARNLIQKLMSEIEKELA